MHTDPAIAATLEDTILSAAYIAGRRAGRDGLSPTACPYIEGSPESQHWQEGRRRAANEAEEYAMRAIERAKVRPAWIDRADFDMNLRGRAA